jgi:vacuolar iron transporter family protein
MGEFLDQLSGMYKAERLHYMSYAHLAKREKDPRMRGYLLQFSEVERKSSDLWASILKKRGVEINEVPAHPFSLLLISFLRSILGLSFALKFLEYGEEKGIERFKVSLSELGNEAERRKITKFIDREIFEENELSAKILGSNAVLDNIRDIVFGMNDGLVEVLAAVVGLAAFLQNSHLILLSGFIVAISGTLSMAGGAYISSDYESKVKGKDGSEKGKKSSLYVGSFYILGALFPLAPFAFGLSGFGGIAFSIVITSLVLAFTATFVSVMSNKSISRNITETLLISLGAAAVTILIGYYARAALHLTI